MPGLYQMIKTHKNGALVRMLGDQNIQLVSSRYNFSILEAISVYTQSVDAISLADVFRSMEQADNNSTPPPDSKATDKELSAYFVIALPDYDRRRVYINDIKKIVKWYKILKEHNALPTDPQNDSTESDGGIESETTTQPES